MLELHFLNCVVLLNLIIRISGFKVSKLPLHIGQIPFVRHIDFIQFYFSYQLGTEATNTLLKKVIYKANKKSKFDDIVY
jgi:hypothetical protein